MEMVINLIEQYGMEVVVLAIVINVVTMLVKIPIKLVAQKLNNPSGLTRFIVFLPLLIGFGAVFVLDNFIKQNLVFNSEFISTWISSSSLSLAIYAVAEKMFTGKSCFMDNTIIESKKAIDEIKSVLIDPGKLEKESIIDEESIEADKIINSEQEHGENNDTTSEAQPKPLKIILGGRKHE